MEERERVRDGPAVELDEVTRNLARESGGGAVLINCRGIKDTGVKNVYLQRWSRCEKNWSVVSRKYEGIEHAGIREGAV